MMMGSKFERPLESGKAWKEMILSLCCKNYRIIDPCKIVYGDKGAVNI